MHIFMHISKHITMHIYMHINNGGSVAHQVNVLRIHGYEMS